jgi:EpsI family protein
MTGTVRFAVTIGLLTAAIGLQALTNRRVPEPLSLPLNRLPNAIDGWSQSGDLKLDPRILKSLNPSAYLVRNYVKDSSQLEVFIAYYALQRAGESMHSPKHCLPGGGWEIWRHGSAGVPVNGKSILVNKYSIANGGNRKLMFYWYQSKNRILANEYLGKFLLAKDTVLTGHTAGTIVRIVLPDRPGADEQGVRFASQLIPDVARCLDADGLPFAKAQE